MLGMKTVLKIENDLLKRVLVEMLHLAVYYEKNVHEKAYNNFKYTAIIARLLVVIQQIVQKCNLLNVRENFCRRQYK